MKKVSHVIFDLDGLLLDTEHMYEAIVRDIVQSFGKNYRLDVRLKVLGINEKAMVKIVVEELGLPVSEEEFLTIYSDSCRQRLRNINLMKGSERLIRHLHEHNIPFSLATSSSEEMAGIKMSSHQHLFDLFQHKVMGSTDPEVRHGKPAPDIFLVAASRFKGTPNPSDCLVFEDAPNGVKAAVSAGMQVVMVPDEIVSEKQRRNATLVLKSLEDFKPELFGLPAMS